MIKVRVFSSGAKFAVPMDVPLLEIPRIKCLVPKKVYHHMK